MANTIYKFELSIGTTQIELPINAKIVDVQVQYEKPCIWVLLNPTEKMKEIHLIKIFGTGHLIREIDGLVYIGTFQLYGGSFIGHAFALKIK